LPSHNKPCQSKIYSSYKWHRPSLNCHPFKSIFIPSRARKNLLSYCPDMRI